MDEMDELLSKAFTEISDYVGGVKFKGKKDTRLSEAATKDSENTSSDYTQSSSLLTSFEHFAPALCLARSSSAQSSSSSTKRDYRFTLTKVPEDVSKEDISDFLRSFLPDRRRTESSPGRLSPVSRPSGLEIAFSGPGCVNVVSRDKDAFVSLMESRPFILWPNKHLDCLFPDYETKEHFHPLNIRRSDGTSVIPDDLPALETKLSTILDGVLTVEIGVRTGTGGRSAVAWFLNDETRML